MRPSPGSGVRGGGRCFGVLLGCLVFGLFVFGVLFGCFVVFWYFLFWLFGVLEKSTSNLGKAKGGSFQKRRSL